MDFIKPFILLILLFFKIINYHHFIIDKINCYNLLFLILLLLLMPDMASKINGTEKTPFSSSTQLVLKIHCIGTREDPNKDHPFNLINYLFLTKDFSQQEGEEKKNQCYCSSQKAKNYGMHEGSRVR